MPTLRLSFSGLCTFVFDPPLDPFVFESGPKLPDAALTEATVLLQRLTRSRLLSNQVNLQNEVLDQHFPLLEFNLSDYQADSTRSPNFHCSPAVDADGRTKNEMTRGVCLLNGEELTITGDGEALDPLRFARLKPAKPADPQVSEEERKSLFWMATLDDAVPGAALNPTLLATSPASNQPILAKVHLTKGRLTTRELTDFAYTLATSGGTSNLNRRVATSFELEMEFQEKVTFNMVANRKGKTTNEQLVLAPKYGDTVQVGIVNMEIDRFIGLDPTTAPRVQADFEVYFDLLQEPIAQRPFLQLAARDNSSTQGGISSCAPSGVRPPGT